MISIDNMVSKYILEALNPQISTICGLQRYPVNKHDYDVRKQVLQARLDQTVRRFESEFAQNISDFMSVADTKSAVLFIVSYRSKYAKQNDLVYKQLIEVYALLCQISQVKNNLVEYIEYEDL